MSLDNPQPDDLLTVRVIKNLVTNPLNKWANSYELQIKAGVATGDITALCMALVRFEKAIHRDVVQFDHMVISTWEADSVPYNPSSFIVVSLTGNGEVGEVGDNLALDKVLVVVRQPIVGRFGHLFYRGVLNEADTEAPAGRTVLTDPAGTAATIASAVSTSDVADLLGDPATADLQLVMINATGTQVRRIIALNATGVTTLPTDHAWFNRTGSP